MNRRDEGSLLKAPGGRWYARIRYTDKYGQPREKKRTCDTHAQAKATLKDIIAEIDDDARERKTYRELDQFFRDNYVHKAKFVGGQKLSGFRQKIVAVEHYLDAALDYFGDRPIDAITYADLRDFKREIAGKPKDAKKGGGQRSIADINHYLKRLRRIFNIAIEQGWLAVNPFKRGEPLIVESFENERTRTLSPAEETRLLAQCVGRRKHLAAVVIFALETGCRRGEMLSLKWSDVDTSARVIRLRATNTKTLKPRLVPITSRLHTVLVGLRANKLRPGSPVFTCGDFKRSFAAACTAAKLADVHFHDLRHTAITRMLEAGIPQPLVMKISGHSQMKTFLRYVNPSESSMLEIAKRLDAAA